MGFETAIYINEKVSHKNVKDFLDNVQDETRIEANVEFNTEKAIKALSKLTNIKNAKIEILPDGAVQSIKQVEVATGKIMTIKERIDEAGNREVQRMMMEIDADKEKLDLEKKQLEAKKEYSKLTSNLSKELSKQSKLQLELENTKGDAKTIVNEELKAQNKIVRSLQNKIKKHSEYNEEGEEYVNIQRQMVENENKLKKLKIQNSSNKQAQNYATILKSQDKEYQLRKQMIKATGEEIVLLQQKVDKEKQIQLSAQQSIYGSKNVNKNMQEVVKTNREIIEQNLTIAEAKQRQAMIDKQSTEAFNKLLALEKQRGQLLNASHGTTGNTQNAYISQIQAVEQQIKQTESLIATEGLENSKKRLEVEQQRKAILDNIAIKEAQSTDKADAQEMTKQKQEQSRLYNEMLATEKEITKLAKQRESITGQEDKKKQELELTRQISALEEKSAQYQEQINTQNLADAQQMLSIENERVKRANEIALTQSKAMDVSAKVEKTKEENAQLKEQKRLYDELFKTEKQIANLSKQKARLGTGSGSEKQRVELEKQIVKLKQNSSVLEFKIQNAGLEHAENMEKVEKDRLELANQLSIIEAKGLDKLDEIEYEKQFNQLLQEQKDLYSQIHKAQADISNLTKKSETTSGEEQLEYQRQLVEAQQRYATVREEINSKNLVSIQEENKLIATQQQLENEMSVIIARKADANKKQAELKAEQDRKNAENERRLADETATYIELAKRKLNNRLKALANSSKGEFIDPEEIDKIKQKIDSLNAIDLKSAKREVQSLSQTITEMGTDARIAQINKVETALDKFKKTLTSLPAQYISLQAAISATTQAFRNAADYVGTVDSAWTNMSMTMGSLTRGDFDDLVTKSSKLASNMGAVSTDVLAIAQTFANDGVEITDVVDKLEASTALMNVSGMNPQEVTSAVMSIANSFRLFEDGTMDVAEATEYLGNIITTVSANMDMDFQKGLQELISGIGTAGSTMKSAGVDMEWFVGTLGNLIVATGKSGTELARSMRTITARIFQQKQTLEEMGESTENLEIEMSNAEKALSQLGITIRGQASGELLPLSEIIDQIAQKWDGLSDASRFFIAETMAGKNQMDTFIGMLDSYASSTKLVTEAQNSQGSLMQMNATYAESLEGKINTLKTAQNDLYQAMLSSDAYKLTVDGLTSILQAMTGLIELLQGRFLAVMAGATIAIISFKEALKGYTLKDQITMLKDWIAEKVTLTAVTGKASLAMSALRGAIAGLGIFGAITAFTQFVKVAKELAPAVSEIEGKVSDLSSAIDNYRNVSENLVEVRSDLTTMKDMVNRLEEENLSINEQQGLISTVNELLKKHAGSYKSIEGVLKNENVALEDRVKLLEQQAEAEAKIAARDALSKITKANVWGNSLLETMQTSANSYASKLASAIRGMKSETDSLFGSEEHIAEKSAQIAEKYSLRISQAKTDLEAISVQAASAMGSIMEAHELGILDDAGFEVYKKQYIELIELLDDISKKTGVDFDIINLNTATEDASKATNGIKAYKSSLNDATKATNTLTDATNNLSDSLGGVADNNSQEVKSQKELNAAYMETVDSLVEAKELLSNITENADYDAISAFANSSLIDNYNGSLSDTVGIQEYLNEKIKEMQIASDEAYFEMNRQDEDFWNNKIKNTEAFIKYQKDTQKDLTQYLADSLGIQYEDFQNYINEKGGLRDVDVSNAQNLAEAEREINQGLTTQLLTLFGGFVNDKAGARVTDMDNIIAFLNAQEGEEISTIQRLVQLWNEYYNAKKAEINSTISVLKKVDATATQVKTDAVNKMNETMDKFGLRSPTNHYQDMYGQANQLKQDVQKATQELQQLETENDKFQSLVNKLSGHKGQASNTLKQSTVGTGGLGNSLGKTNSSSGSSSGGREGTERVVEDLELVIDRYYELNDALADVNNKLEMNRKLQDSTRDLATRKKLMEEEVELLKEQLKATENLYAEQKKELQETKNQLSRAGFTFNSEGNITNYASRLKQMQNYANSLSGDAKQAEIEYVQSIESIISAYTTLANSTLPSTQLQLENLRYELENINKEHEKTLALIETLGDRYYDIESAIKKVENALSLNQAKQQTANASERVKLMEEEVELMKERQKLLLTQKSEVEKEAEEIAKKLAGQGVEFNSDGSVKNYQKLMQTLTNNANKLVGDARDEAVESAEELIALIEQYDGLIKDTLPSLEVEWENYTASIKEAEKAMAQHITDVQKDISSAIEKELNKRTEKIKSELQKQKDLYNAQYEQEDWDRSLASEQRKLDEIQQQINDLSRDTSLAGRLKLQQLREEYEAQQQVIDDMIRDKEKENGNARFDEEMEKLDQELEDALDPQNIADLVNKALVDGFVTIGDEVVALDTLMTDWLNETGDGLYAVGNTLKSELIENLRVAQGLLSNMGIIDVGAELQRSINLGEVTNSIPPLADMTKLSRSMVELQKTKTTNTTLHLESLLTVQGNVTEDVLPQLEAMIDTAKTEVFDNIARQITSR